jgi:hypothetical protein
MNGQTKLVTLPVRPELHQRLKVIASARGMKLRALHELILEEWLDGGKESPEKKLMKIILNSNKLKE